jgi:hypothetical protein
MNANTKSQIKEAANLVGKGIQLQDEQDFAGAKPLIQQGIDGIKNILIKENSSEKAILFEYVLL